MRLEIDRESPTPIYVQIRNRLRERILSGELPEGLRLPPERELAQHLGVNRTTVLNAYRELKAEGLVSAHVGRGTVVCRMEKPQDEGGEILSAPLHWERYLRPLPDDSRDGIMRQIWDRCPSPEVACFSCGMPDRGLFPTELMGELHARAFREAGPEVLDLMPVEGYFPLREALADLMRHRGINASPEDVVVTGGSQQGVDLLARMMVESGDGVAAEDPLYVNGRAVLNSLGARIYGVPMDRDGMRPDVLEGLLRRYALKFVYVGPNFQNPTGVVMSSPRRCEILDLARRHQVPVLEDDPYFDLRYEGADLPPIKALDSSGHVLYASTASKTLVPGLRLGWVVLPRPMVRRFVRFKRGADLATNGVAQWVLHRYIVEGHYQRHLERVRREYAHRLKTMEDLLAQEEPRTGWRWHHPQGGMFIWLELPEGVDAQRFALRAAARGVVCAPGSIYAVDGGNERFLRINFTLPSQEAMAQGVPLMVKALHECLLEDRTLRRSDAESLSAV